MGGKKREKKRVIYVSYLKISIVFISDLDSDRIATLSSRLGGRGSRFIVSIISWIDGMFWARRLRIRRRIARSRRRQRQIRRIGHCIGSSCGSSSRISSIKRHRTFSGSIRPGSGMWRSGGYRGPPLVHATSDTLRLAVITRHGLIDFTSCRWFHLIRWFHLEVHISNKLIS